jgi:hypothetical protein
MANKQVNHLKATRVRTEPSPSPWDPPVEIYFPKWPAPGAPGGDHKMHANLRDWGDVLTKPYRIFESKLNQPEPRGVALALSGAVSAKPASRTCQDAGSNPARQPATSQHGTATGRKPEASRPDGSPKPTGSQLAVLEQVSTAPLQTWSRPGSLSR